MYASPWKEAAERYHFSENVRGAWLNLHVCSTSAAAANWTKMGVGRPGWNHYILTNPYLFLEPSTYRRYLLSKSKPASIFCSS
jgi:hypothetical protein